MKRILCFLFLLTVVSAYAMDQEHISINYNPNMHLIIADCRLKNKIVEFEETL